jgi:chromosome partitioning protein
MGAYVFANQKGGVGKTTVTLGVAAALAGRGARVLLIDLDPQASATKVLGVESQERCTMADVLLEPGRYPLSDAITRSAWGFDVAPAEMALASRESRRSTADEFVLRNSSIGLGRTTWCSSTARRVSVCLRSTHLPPRRTSCS